ncbi:MAG: hypothetical protein HZA66_24590 [Rhodopseudomonas palustris]|uniref:Uncharacterized protein n=1 Tax=Rhodopseudomonas palustris TaxID=1076 RepID=A0A933S3V7_RHOPL|nr:hypothetical protein [Rhodopseudomonas palustris]
MVRRFSTFFFQIRPPADLRVFVAIQDAVVIEKEVRKGDLGHPAVVSNAELLHKQVWDRWQAGEGLAPSGPQIAQVMDRFAEIAERQLSLLEKNSEKAIHLAAVERVDCPPEQSTISPPDEIKVTTAWVGRTIPRVSGGNYRAAAGWRRLLDRQIRLPR